MQSRATLPLVGSLTLSEMFGHSAFLLSGTAFLDPDILNLRVFSMLSGGATMVFAYFHPVGHPLWLPFGWNLLFMGINASHIYRIKSEQWAAEALPAEALALWRGVFEQHGVSSVDFAKLLAAGTWATLRKGATLQQEGKPSNSVFLLVRGGADVAMGGVAPSHTVNTHQACRPTCRDTWSEDHADHARPCVLVRMRAVCGRYGAIVRHRHQPAGARRRWQPRARARARNTLDVARRAVLRVRRGRAAVR